MEKYQGEDIHFKINFQKGEDVGINSFADLSEIVFYVYTDGCYIARFSYPAKEGYETLTFADNFTLSGLLTASMTKTMSPGILCVEARAKKGSENMIEKRFSGIVLTKNLIKSEI